VVRNEELRRACQISHAVRLPELAHFHRAQRSQTPGSARIRPSRDAWAGGGFGRSTVHA
jgi:hypothetical protein